MAKTRNCIGYVATIYYSHRDLNGNTYWAMSIGRCRDYKWAHGIIDGGEGNALCALRVLADRDGVRYTYTTKELGKREYARMVDLWPSLGCTEDQICPAVEAQFKKNV